MPLYAQEHMPIPTKDILSWCYDNRAAYDQDKPIYIDAAQPERSISAAQAFTFIRKLVAGFRAAGLQKGDAVCIHGFNDLYYPILVLGIIGAGGVWFGTNPSYQSFELWHALKAAKAKFIISESDLVSAIKTPAKEIGVSSERILLLTSQDDQGGLQSWRSLLNHGEEDWVRFDDYETARTTTAFLMFSSGTTGLPKAAQLSHYNLIAEHTLVHENPKHPEPFAMSRHACLPMFHAAVAPFVHVTVLRSGRPAYVMRRFQLMEFLKYTERYQITSLVLVPPMVVAIVNLARDQPELVRRCLRSVVSVVAGAAPLDKETQNALQAFLSPSSTFTQLLGMTETSCICSYLYYPERDDTGSVGRFLPNIDVKLVDDDGNEIDSPYDTRGELCVRGPTIIRGYLENPEANRRDWDDEGFFHTGDIVYCDEKTRLWYVVDRKKELIKVRGFQVAPSEIEGVLLMHPEIRDAAVIGVDGGASGEVPRGYVVKKEGSTLTAEALLKYLDERLARYKRLEGGVRFVESIPKTASGKILKRIMREEAKKENQKLTANL